LDIIVDQTANGGSNNGNVRSNQTDVRSEKRTFKLGDFFAKVDRPGAVICQTCDGKTPNYSARGIATLKDHASSAKHKKVLASKLQTQTINNYLLSDNMSNKDDSSKASTATSDISQGSASGEGTTSKPLPALMCDRVATIEVSERTRSSTKQAWKTGLL
jgi:hypothetical protein